MSAHPSCAYPGCGYERPQSASAAGGSGTVYPPDGGSSPHGASQGQESAPGFDRPTAGSPAERLRLAAETLDGDTARLSAPLAAWLRDEAVIFERSGVRNPPPGWPSLAVADVILGATR
jgi:hypothetical protein